MRAAISNGYYADYEEHLSKNSGPIEGRLNKFAGVKFNITLNEMYGGNYNYDELIQFIQTYIDTPSPSLGEYRLYEISPGKPGAVPIEILRMNLELDNEKNVKISFYEVTLETKVPINIPGNISSLQFLYGFICGWAYSVIQQRY